MPSGKGATTVLPFGVSQQARRAVTDRLGRDDQVLHNVIFVALEDRACRDRGGDDLVLNDDCGLHLAAAPALLAREGLGRFGGLLHAAGFGIGPDRGEALLALQPRDLLA